MDITLLVGANATGKSTRLKTLVDLLTNLSDQPTIDYEYTFFDTKKDKTRTVVIGRLFPDGTLILGSEAKNDAGWVCLDKAILSTQDMRTDFYKWVMENDTRVKHIVAEGYFNCTSPKMRPEYLRKTGFETINCLFMYYDTVEQFHKRTTERSGSGRDMEWAQNCAGWKDNSSFKRSHEKSLEQDLDYRQNVIRLDIDAPRNALFDVVYQCPF